MTNNDIRKDEYLHCIRCGLCLSTCPTYQLTLKETDSPRARVALLRAMREGLLERPTDYTAAQYFRCLLCGACTFICPSGVTVDRLLELTRREMAELGLMPHPLVALNERVVEHHNISGEPNENRLMWAENLPEPPSGIGRERAEVVYFVGCVSALFPRSYRVAQSFVEVLERGGVDYALLGEQEWCCGYPMAINGGLDQARETIRHNVEAVRARGARLVVTTCPSCFYFWKHTYPVALGEELGFEVVHSTEFLADLLEAGRLPLRPDLPEQVVTYHDPCDLGRKGGVFDAPRRILAAIPGVTLVEMEENQEGSHCCGGGGNLESFDPEMSRAIAARRVRQAAGTGARVVVSACQQCERTLFNAARTERIRVRVKDITEIVLDALESRDQ
ncbi:MAG TPA: (Fe-S)-binding protein [Chloroflexi bacterium]|nr:(Fe-S)-binding protein [Chloroflexota bacterium]